MQKKNRKIVGEKTAKFWFLSFWHDHFYVASTIVFNVLAQ